jgi:sugar O-acyltransferase (sialic acid O-acetyltransferase NeuD family)
MSEAQAIIIPLVNPNEPGALIAELYVNAGQHVMAGEKVCILETTKSTLELLAETEGYVAGLRAKQGQTIQAGELLCYLSASPDWSPPETDVNEATYIEAPRGIRISQPALQLALQYNLDLSQLTSDVFITEKMVLSLVESSSMLKPGTLIQSYDPNSIIVYGGGGHGKSLIDLIRVLGIYSIVGIVDDGIQNGTNIMGVPILGGANILGHLFESGIHMAANAVGGIGNITTRVKVFDSLSQAGFSCPILMHPTAFVEPSAILSDGVQIMPHAYVGSEARLGFGAIINTGAIVSHDCTLGAYANLSPGAILAGEVSIGDGVLVGMGVTVNLQVKIGKHARIGNGATVKQDVPEGRIVHAGTVWPAV